MIPDYAGNAENWDFDKLVVILLRQFKRLLAEHGVELTDGNIQKIGADAAARKLVPNTASPIRDALVDIIKQSEDVLSTLGLTFAQSLKTTMTDLSGWETTADFLQLANEKINAEVRISAGASLLAVLGDLRYIPHLMQAVEHDLETQGQLDVDAVIAKRALLFAAHIEANTPNWLERLRAWTATLS